MDTSRTFSGSMRYIFLLFVFTMSLIVLLGLSFTIWVSYGSSSVLMNQVGLQRAREQRMVKDVLLLAQHTQQSQALNELQVNLPVWEKAQRGLSLGDSSLGLPAHPPSSVTFAVLQTQSDYVALDAAFHTIITQDAKVDPLQLQAVLAHERSYYTAMSIVNTLWQQQIDTVFVSVFWIQITMLCTIVVTVCASYFLTRRRVKRAIEKKE